MNNPSIIAIKIEFCWNKKNSINDKPQKPRQTHEFDSRLELMRFFVWFLSFYHELAENSIDRHLIVQIKLQSRWKLDDVKLLSTLKSQYLQSHHHDMWSRNETKNENCAGFFLHPAKYYKVKLAHFFCAHPDGLANSRITFFSVPDRRLCVVVMYAIYPRERLMVRDELFIWRGFFFLETSAFFCCCRLSLILVCSPCPSIERWIWRDIVVVKNPLSIRSSLPTHFSTVSGWKLRTFAFFSIICWLLVHSLVHRMS